MSAQFVAGVVDHIVSMTRDYSGRTPRSVATCECGWTSSVPVDEWREQDASIDAHWRNAVSKGAAIR